MEIDLPEFHLASELRGHLEDVRSQPLVIDSVSCMPFPHHKPQVRGVISIENQEGVPVSFIATSSRDRMIKVWHEENGAYRESKTLVSN